MSHPSFLLSGLCSALFLLQPQDAVSRTYNATQVMYRNKFVHSRGFTAALFHDTIIAIGQSFVVWTHGSFTLARNGRLGCLASCPARSPGRRSGLFLLVLRPFSNISDRLIGVRLYLFIHTRTRRHSDPGPGLQPQLTIKLDTRRGSDGWVLRRACSGSLGVRAFVGNTANKAKLVASRGAPFAYDWINENVPSVETLRTDFKTDPFGAGRKRNAERCCRLTSGTSTSRY